MTEFNAPEKDETDNDFPMDLVTVGSFTYMYEAELLAAKLDSEGITAYIPDSMTINTNPFLAGGLGGIRVQISQDDVAKARELLTSLQNKSKPDPIKHRFVTHNGQRMRLNNGVCMECGAAGFYITIQPIWRTLLSYLVIFSVEMPYSKPRRCWCSECNAEWKL
ncbi:MAG: DUF2007 domain-containing protein [Bacteroidia bacterium]|jgi:hypothetical protein|nr:DUF2007 domain-containing protein [Bacteroidia bacterium]